MNHGTLRERKRKSPPHGFPGAAVFPDLFHGSGGVAGALGLGPLRLA